MPARATPVLVVLFLHGAKSGAIITTPAWVPPDSLAHTTTVLRPVTPLARASESRDAYTNPNQLL